MSEERGLQRYRKRGSFMGLTSSWFLIIFAGVFLVALVLLLFTGGISWFGRLPGDIHYSGKNTKVFIPLTSMLLLSLALSLLLSVLNWFFR
jgi:hypothetical protein